MIYPKFHDIVNIDGHCLKLKNGLPNDGKRRIGSGYSTLAALLKFQLSLLEQGDLHEVQATSENETPQP